MSQTIEDIKAQQAAEQTAEQPAVGGSPPAVTGGPGEPRPGGGPAGTPTAITDLPEAPIQYLRPALAAAVISIGTGFLVGGMFTGFMPRVFAALGAIGGVLLAVWGTKATKRQTLIMSLSLAGIFVLGALAILTVDFSGISRLPKIVGEAIKNARLHRPPVAFEDGWRPVIVWTLASLSYASAWIGIEMRRPAMGVLLPMPVIVFSAIAQPPEAQLAGGIVALVTFVIALAIIFRPDYGGEGGGMPTSYELRRAARTAPLVILLVVALIGLSQANLLFPEPLYDPTQKAQLPKAVPLSDVVDRPLFQVRSKITGPWRTGVLDVYQGNAWRLPPYSASSLEPISKDGILNSSLRPQAKATIELLGLDGTVLPLPPRSYAIQGKLPALVTDDRSGTLRVATGQVKKGIKYEIAFTLLPEEADLTTAPPPGEALQPFLEVPPPPPAVQRLLDEAPDTSQWERLDFVRKRLLDTVAATGSGLPVEVPPEKVADMLEGSKEGTPFEIVAGQALLARWTGVPSRIGYGFDLGEEIGADLREIRPRNGSMWLEVNFEGFGWLPITGMPKKAKKSTSGEEQIEVPLLPSDEIAVQLFLPLKTTPADAALRKLQALVMLVVPFALLAGLIYALWPLVVKTRRRAKRRAWAQKAGPRARIAVAYVEFRELATDLGTGDPHATPLAFLELVVPDDEHTELAWLVTRTQWGDLQDRVTPDEVFAAEELSRSLRRRMFEAQPFTIRFLSLISRLSLKTPYAPELSTGTARAPKRSKKEVAHASA